MCENIVAICRKDRIRKHVKVLLRKIETIRTNWMTEFELQFSA